MNCSKYVEHIARRLDGSLPQSEFAELEEHLKVCGRCRAEYRLQKKIMGALGEEMYSSGLSPDFTHRVMARTHEIAEARRRAEKWAPLVPALVFAATSVVLFIFRTEVSGALAPAMEIFARFVGSPVARLGDAFAGLFPGSVDLPAESVPLVQRVSQPVVLLATTLALAFGVAIWAMRKAASFLRG